MEVIEQLPQSAVTRQDDGIRERLHCTVWLPGVSSVSEFTVRIQPGSLRLHAPGRYLLDLRLDAAVEERPEELKFVKKRCELRCVLLVVDAPPAAAPALAPPPREPPAARPEQPALHESFLAEAARLRDGPRRAKGPGKGRRPVPAPQPQPAPEREALWGQDAGSWQREAGAGLWEGVDPPGTPPSEHHPAWPGRGGGQPDSDDAELEPMQAADTPPAPAAAGGDAAAADADAAAAQQCLAGGAVDAMRAGDHALAASLARQARAAGSRDGRLATLLQMCEVLAAAPDGPGGRQAALAAAGAAAARPAWQAEPPQPPEAAPGQPQSQPQPRASSEPAAPAADGEGARAEPLAGAARAAEGASAAAEPADPRGRPQASPAASAEAPAAPAGGSGQPSAEPAEREGEPEPAPQPQPQPAEAGASSGQGGGQARRKGAKKQQPQQPQEQPRPQQARRQEGQAGRGGGRGGRGGKGGKEAQRPRDAGPKPASPANPAPEPRPAPEPKRARPAPKPAPAARQPERRGRPGVLRRAWWLLAWLAGWLAGAAGAGLELAPGFLAMLAERLGWSSLSSFLLVKQEERSASGLAVQIASILLFAGACYLGGSTVLLCGAVAREGLLTGLAACLWLALASARLAWAALVLLLWAPAFWSSALFSLGMLFSNVGLPAWGWTFYACRLWAWPLAAWACGGGLAGWAQLWPCFVACIDGSSLLLFWLPSMLVRWALAWAGAPAWLQRWGSFAGGLAWTYARRGRGAAGRAGKAAGGDGGGPAAAPEGASGEVARVLGAADFYEVLGLPRGADADALRAAKRAKALLTHPDKLGAAPGATEAFRRVNEAHELLSDPGKRAAYDAELGWRAAAAEGRAGGAGGPGGISIPCTGCGQAHTAPFLDRPLSAARWCDACGEHHPAGEGDLWFESRSRTWLGRRRIRTLVVLGGRVADVSEVCGWRLPDAGTGALPVNSHDPCFDISELRAGGPAAAGGRRGRKGRRK